MQAGKYERRSTSKPNTVRCIRVQSHANIRGKIFTPRIGSLQETILSVRCTLAAVGHRATAQTVTR